jgi:hypothetical protein
MENGPRPARAEFTPRARPRSSSKPKTGPRPACPQITLPVPGRHAARDGNQHSGPLALSASHAPDRNLGLGRESFIPPGLNLGPVIVSHPSQSDGCTKFPVKQNRARRPRATLALILIFSAHSRAAAQPGDSVGRRARAEGAHPRRRLEPLAGVRAHHWVNAPPSSGLNGASSRSLAPTRR